MENYFKQLMNDGYELLVAETIVWPYELSDSQKAELLQLAIKYFQDQEEYEKCAILKTRLDKLFIPAKQKIKSYDKKKDQN